MGRGNPVVVDKISVKVPAGQGHIIGDLLRKYAVCGRASWQVIAYYLPTYSIGFGFSDGTQVSSLVLLKGAIVCKNESLVASGQEVRIEQFRWNGSFYDSADFELHGISHAVGDVITACVRYSAGHYSAAQNHALLKEKTGEDVNNYYAVPSSHSSLGTFRYTVTNIDQSTDWLNIEADRGAVDTAYKLVIRTLMGLNI